MRARWVVLFVIVAASVGGAGLLLRRVGPNDAPAPVAGTRLFESVLQFVRSQSVDSITDEELYRLAASGVVTELDDPYAVLSMPGERRSAFEDRAAPLGLHLDRRDGGIVVIATIPGSPADGARIESGDELIGIGTVGLEAEDLEQALALLDGPEGSTVELRLRRPGFSPFSRAVERARSPATAPVTASAIGSGVGLVRLSGIPRHAADSVGGAIDRLRSGGVRSLILDLRRTVGGDLADGTAIADLFLDTRAVLAATRGRSKAEGHEVVDSTPARFPDLPLVLLVDRGTAGAAEVLAGALQDHDRAAVLGTPTFGRGVTQRDFPLGAGASVRLTTAFWYTPFGRQIQTPTLRDGADTLPRPKVKSAGGRTLLGGGGIVPHQEVEEAQGVDRPLAAARALLARASSTRAVLGQLDTP